MKLRLLWIFVLSFEVFVIMVNFLAQKVESSASINPSLVNHSATEVFLYLLAHEEAEPGGPIFVQSNLIYMAFADKLVIFDTMSPNQVQSVGSVFLDSPIQEIFVSAGYAYVLTNSNLQIVNVTDPQHIQLLSSLTLQSPTEIMVAQNIAYIIDDTYGLHSIDVSNPQMPFELSVVESVGNRFIGLQNDILYLVTAQGMTVLSVASPEQPVLLATYQFSPPFENIIGYAGYLNGHTIYLFGSDYFAPSPRQYSLVPPEPIKFYLSSLDVANPIAPQEMGIIPLPEDFDAYSLLCCRAFMVGNYIFSINENAFVINPPGTLLVYEVIDPTHVQQLGGVTVEGGAKELVIADNRAYVVNNDGVQFVDVTIPTTPQPVGSYHTVQVDKAMFGTDGSVLYSQINDQVGSFQILDVSDPIDPTLLSRYDSTGIALLKAFDVVDGVAYTFWEDTNSPATWLEMIDVAEPITPKMISRYMMTTTQPQDVQIKVVGNYAYILLASTFFEEGELVIVDVTDPENPVQMDNYVGFFQEMAVRGNYVYVRAFEPGRLLILNISDPSNIAEVGFVEEFYGKGPIIQEDFAYVFDDVNDQLYLKTLDLSNPLQPTVVFTETEPFMDPLLEYPQNLTVAGDYLYVRTGESIVVYDVSVPQAVVRVTAAMKIPCGLRTAVHNNLIVATDPFRGWCVFHQLPTVSEGYLSIIRSP